jgi:predicted dehydrogenase
MYKVGIFGTGPLAKIHADTWQEIPGVSIVGFFAPDYDTSSELVDTYPLRGYASEAELMRDCDLVDVVYPLPNRFGLCEKAIRLGKHVLVESPMAYTMNEAEQLVKLVQESSVKMQVANTELFNPAFLSLKDMELQPLFIEAHRTVPFQRQDKEVNVVFDLMLHDINLVLSLVKSEVKNISASGVAVMTDTSDIVNARIAFNNGCVANLTASRIETAIQHEMRLFQKDAYIDLDSYNNRLKTVRLKEPGKDSLTSSSQDAPQDSQFNATRQELEEFLAAVQNNTRTVVNEIDGYRAMEVAHHILQKITSNFSTTP